MVTFIKWLTPFLTTALTISIGVFIAWKMLDEQTGYGGFALLGVITIFFMYILPLSLGIGVLVGILLSVLVIPRILKEKPPPPKTLSPLICTQCKNVSTNLWPGAFCPNCGSSLEPQPNNVPPKKKSSNLIFSILAVILIFIIIVFYIGLTVQTGSESQPTAKQYFDMGVSNLVPNQYEKAIDDFTKAIELNPRYFDAYWQRASAYSNLGQYESALADYTKSIELNPDFAYPYYERGLVYYKLEQYEEALKDYDKTLELDLNHPQAMPRRTQLLEEHPELKP